MSNKPKRIELIDNFRAMAMIYVLFIHTLFWTFLFFEDIKSLFLIEMPLFFTITGMSHYFARTDDLLKFYISRLRRILLPYWICAFLFITLNILSIKFHILPLLNSEPVNIIDLILSWLNPFSSKINETPYLDLAMWFIPVYLCVCLIIPLFKNLFVNLSGKIKFIPAIILIFINFCCSSIIQVNDLLQSTLFYMIFVYAGFYFVSSMNKSFCFKVSIVSLILLFFAHHEFTFDMQANKFPPNIMFLIYNMIFIPIIYIFSQQINNLLKFMCGFKPFSWIFTQFKDKCYTIFLYQPIAFIVAYILLRMILNLELFFIAHEIIGLIIYWLTVVIIAAFLGKLLGRFERI